MKNLINSIIVILLIVLITFTSSAQIPRTISFQGVLTDSLGNPAADALWPINFRLYDAEVSGNQLWIETIEVKTNRGLFSATLGSVTPFGASVRFDKPYWLSIQVVWHPEMGPRIPLTAVGYSFNSLKSDTAIVASTIPDGIVTGSKILDNSITSAKIVDGTIIASDFAKASITSEKIASGQVVKALNGLRDNIYLSAVGGATVNSSNDTIYINAGSGGGGTGIQGIQNTNNTLTIVNPNGPTATVNLKVPLSLSDSLINIGSLERGVIRSTNSGSASAIYGVQTASGKAFYGLNTGTGKAGVFEINNASNNQVALTSETNGSGTAVYGLGKGTGRAGVFTIDNASNTQVALTGQTNCGSGTAVYGLATATSGTNYGVYGTSNSPSGRGVQGVSPYLGTYGRADATTGVNYGVYGKSMSADGYGVYGTAEASSSVNYGVYGTSNSPYGQGVHGVSPYIGTFGRAEATTGVNYGVYGSNFSSSGYGVFGNAHATSGVNYGVYGTSNSPSGRGVQGVSPYLGTYGRAEATTGVNYGVYGRSNSTEGYGVYGIAAASSGYNFGVYGASNSPDGNGVLGAAPIYGVVGFAGNTGGDRYGVYGSVAGEGGGPWAGYFAGCVKVTGFLAKGSGSFKIDHPLDPKNKYLYHSFVESPDMMNIYNGNVELNDKGEAVVQLPDWFGALNKDFRYQLTSIGAPGPNLFIAMEVNNNQFKIAGGTSGMKVSWQVTGIRKDAYAEKNRIPVEEDKVGDELGKYLHPEAFGQPREEGIPYMQMPTMLKDKLMLQKNFSDPDAALPEHQAPPQSDNE